jgi:predicted nuclease with TOPRIM domain
MDQELKQYLQEMEKRIDARFQDLETRLKEHMAGVVDAAKEEMKDFTRETVRAMETRIVGSFSEVAATHETRLRTHESATKTITDSLLERMSLLESRMLRLERRQVQ